MMITGTASTTAFRVPYVVSNTSDNLWGPPLFIEDTTPPSDDQTTTKVGSDVGVVEGVGTGTTLPPTTTTATTVSDNDDEDDNHTTVTAATTASSTSTIGISKFASLPYAPFGRSDRLGRAADFSLSGMNNNQNQNQSGGNNNYSNNHQPFYSQNRYHHHDNNNNNRYNKDGQKGGRDGGGRDGGGRDGGGRDRYNNNNSQQQQQQQRYTLNPFRDDDDIKNERGDGYDNHTNDRDFQLVDTTKTATTNKRFVNQASKRRQHSIRLRQINARRQQQQQGGAGSNGGASSFMLDKMSISGGRGGAGGNNGGGRGGPPGMGGGRGGPSNGGRFGSGGRGGPNTGGRGYYTNRQVDRQPSVSVQSDWKQVEEIALGKLSKNIGQIPVNPHHKETVPKVEDILWCGFLDPYNDMYEKVSTRTPVPLKRMEHKEFYPVTTTDDPVLEKLAIDGVGNVFITDAILAHLMTCTRSVYPWDIVITKLPGGTLFFDKRDNSQFDYLTVQETSYNPPVDTSNNNNNNTNNPNDNNTTAATGTEKSDTNINSPDRLGLEATMINQNFSQQILKTNKTLRKQFELPNPFFDEDDAQGMEPASVAYRYRKFTLDDNITVIVRAELHAYVTKGTTSSSTTTATASSTNTDNSSYMTSFALNEYTPGIPPSVSHYVNPNSVLLSWREKLDSQRGAVLATEFKNNSFKLAKWTAQSILADCDLMKIGFITRTNHKNPYEHLIVGTQFYRPKDLAIQITLQEIQMWNIFKMLLSLLFKPTAVDGKYVLMRDPNKPLLYLYKVPNHTFEDNDE